MMRISLSIFIPGLILGLLPFITNGASDPQVFDATLNKKDNTYTQNFNYPNKKKQRNAGYISLGIDPDSVGLSGWFIFNSMALADKKRLYQQYKTKEERILNGPKRQSSIRLNNRLFVSASTPINTGEIYLYFPFIANEISFKGDILSEHNEMDIILDKKIQFDATKDARKNRLDWINTSIFVKNDIQGYDDQIQLKVTDPAIYGLDIRGGCLSSKPQGRIKGLKVFMTEVGEKAKLKNLNILDLDYADPAFHTSFMTGVPIKLDENILMPIYKQHIIKLVCTTTKGKQLETQYTYTPTRLPRLVNEY